MSAAALASHPPPPPPSTHAAAMMSLSSATSPLMRRSTESPPRPSANTSSMGHNEPPPQLQLPSPPKATKDAPPPQAPAQPMLTQHVQEDQPMASPIHSSAPAKSPEDAPAQPAASAAAEKDVSPPLLQLSRSPTASPNNSKDKSNTNTMTSSNSEQAPAQLALLLSSALSDADALRRELASEKKRASRAERLLNALQAPASPNSVESARNNTAYTDGRLPESAAKAVVDAETRAEQAERSRDDALHALASLSTCFADLERYEAVCALRASDARANFSRLFATLGTGHSSPHTQPSHSSPSVSAASPREELRLNLPSVPAPLPALLAANQLLGPGSQTQSHLSTLHAHSRSHSHGQNARNSRPLPSHASFGTTHSPIDGRQTSAFDSLPLPPPPSASVHPPLGTNLPSKRSHGRSSQIDEARYEEQKRRRLANEDGETLSPYGHRGSGSSSRHSHSGHYTSGSGSAQPLSAHPTATLPFGQSHSPSARLYDRPPSVQYPSPLAPGQSFHRDGPLFAGTPPGAGGRYPAYEDHEREYAGREREREGPGMGGLGRVDARELVRDAKARERRGRERESFLRNTTVPQGQSQSQPTNSGRQRSASRSSMGSKDSMSLDEMLLETATERGRGRPSPSSGAHQPVVGFTSSQGQGYPSNNGSPSYTVPPPLPSSQSIAKAPSSSMHAPASNGARKNSVPASQLMTLGPSGVVVSGGGAGAAAAAGAAVDASVDPAVRYPGLRTCRQCGMPGRYKEGKCVEKWGPGPQGPGTVCDRCRKKMKRVERRGTLDSANLGSRVNQTQAQKNSHSPLPAAHSQSYSQSYTQSQSQPQAQPQHRSSRAPARTDTLIVDSVRTRSRSPVSTYPAASASARHPSLAGQPHYASTQSHSQSQSQSQNQTRRAPTPPYINSISTREQYGGPAGSSSRLAPPAGHRATNGGGRVSRESSLEDENELLDEEDAEARRVNGVASSGSRSTLAGYAHSYARGTLGRGQGEQDELEDDADGDAEDVDADADAEGIDVDVEPDADADIMDAVDATMKVED